MDPAMIIGIGGFIGLCIIAWIYYTIKEKLKRNVFLKDQYEEQKKLTHQNMVITTNKSIAEIRKSIEEEIKIDDSVKGAFVGGIYKKIKETENRIEYLHTSKISTGGEGDEFSGSVTFNQLEEGAKVIVCIDRWREKDGVTRKAGIMAMQEFENSIIKAVKNIDGDVKIEFIDKK